MLSHSYMSRSCIITSQGMHTGVFVLRIDFQKQGRGLHGLAQMPHMTNLVFISQMKRLLVVSEQEKSQSSV